MAQDGFLILDINKKKAAAPKGTAAFTIQVYLDQ